MHSALHLANVNALMLYLLSVIWVATHYSRAAAVLASVLGVATFDFVYGRQRLIPSRCLFVHRRR